MTKDPRIKECIAYLKKEVIPICEIIKKLGISNTMFYKWKAQGLLDEYYAFIENPAFIAKSKVGDGKSLRPEDSKHFVGENPGGGRARGQPTLKSIFLRDITPESSAEILDIFLRKCKDGETDCILFAMKRLYPETPSQRYTNIKMAKQALTTIQGVREVSADVVADVAEGNVSLEDATGFLGLLDKHQNVNMGVLNDDVDKFNVVKKAQEAASGMAQ